MNAVVDFANKGGYDLTDGARNAMKLHMAKAYSERDNTFGNGRYARNLFEDTIEMQANRIVGIDKEIEDEGESITDEDLKTFTKEDIPEYKSQIELTPEELEALLNLTLEPPEKKAETEIVSIEEPKVEETKAKKPAAEAKDAEAKAEKPAAKPKKTRKKKAPAKKADDSDSK